VLIAQAAFLLERGQTDKQANATERRTHAGGYTAGVGNSSTKSNVVSNLRTANQERR